MEENTSYVVNKNLKANSYEIGSAGKRFKLYFEDIDDLTAQILDLKMAGLLGEGDDEKKKS